MTHIHLRKQTIVCCEHLLLNGLAKGNNRNRQLVGNNDCQTVDSSWGAARHCEQLKVAVGE